jgi:hypothetical protein
MVRNEHVVLYDKALDKAGRGVESFHYGVLFFATPSQVLLI